MTHKAAQLWPIEQFTRAWHHPEFDPDSDADQHRRLAKRLKLSRVVFDDPEPDDFVHISAGAAGPVDLAVIRSVSRIGETNRVGNRLHIYRSLRDEHPAKSGRDFEYFDEFMRLDLAKLEPIQVDFDAIPFGHDNGPRNVPSGKRQAAPSRAETVAGEERCADDVSDDGRLGDRGDRPGARSKARVATCDGST